MMSTNLMDMENLSLMMEEYGPEGLSLFSQDVDLFDQHIGLKDNGAPKAVACEVHDVFSDLLSSDSISDPFGEEWMENVDLGHFLDGDDCSSVVIADSLPALPVKLSGLDILHGLLTESNAAIDEASIPPLLVELAEPPVLSPDSQVAPDLLLGIDVLDSLADDGDVNMQMSFDSGYGDQSVLHPVYSFDLDKSTEPSSIMTLSPEEIDSVLSASEPSSPSSDISTPDSSYLDNSSDEDYTPTKFKNKSKKSRNSPYPLISEVKPVSKKEKKKMQNKNAAIRYRMKKKAETKTLRSEEDVLSDKNAELKDKVEQLTREIQYMKDLMAEVYKAKGLLK